MVNANERYTFVDPGRVGCLGDTFTINCSQSLANINDSMWLMAETKGINGTIVKPYLVRNLAFALSNSLMKVYPHLPPPGQPKRCNKIGWARTVVEQTFGATKAHFKIVTRACFNDAVPASRVAPVCCALFNICEHTGDRTVLGHVPDTAA